MTDKKYQSVEQKIEEKILKPVGRGAYDFGKKALNLLGREAYDFGGYFYGAVASILRIPTSIRKMANKQAIQYKLIPTNRTGLGALVGAVCGACLVDTPIIWDVLDYINGKETALFNGEALLYTLLATNLASAGYELRRLSKSKQERVEIVEMLKNSELEGKVR